MVISELERRHAVEKLDEVMAVIELAEQDWLIEPEVRQGLIEVYAIFGVKYVQQ